MPETLVEQFTRRLQARLLDPPGISNRELSEILAVRLGLTKGACRVQLDFQDGLCVKMLRRKERVTPPAGQIQPAPSSGCYLLLRLLGLSGWSAAVLPDRQSEEGGIVLSIRRLGRAPIERRGPNVAAVVVEVYEEALRAAGAAEGCPYAAVVGESATNLR